MTQKLTEVVLVFTVNDKGMPVIKFRHDKDSDSIEQKLLGVFVKAAKANSNTLHIESTKQFSDDQEDYEITIPFSSLSKP